jgi:hypothetical protein
VPWRTMDERQQDAALRAAKKRSGRGIPCAPGRPTASVIFSTRRNVKTELLSVNHRCAAAPTMIDFVTGVLLFFAQFASTATLYCKPAPNSI